MRANFLRWAQKNLSLADQVRLREIDRTYRDTARGLELLRPEKELDEEDLQDAAQIKSALRSGE
jgi:hypothetical protein